MSDSETKMPQEIWRDILKTLPVKTLGQCTCVCKSWYSLISSPSFITAHLNTSKPQNPFLLFSHFSVKPTLQEYFSFCLSDASDPDGLQTQMAIRCPFTTRNGNQFRVVGSVNGLICLSDDLLGYSYTIIVWNPMVQRYINLPKPRANFDAIGPYMYALGFGYDAQKGDHKVVRVAYAQMAGGCDRTPPLVEVYSQKEGSWRWVSAEQVDYCIPEYWSQCFVNGAIHWVAFERGLDLAFSQSLLLLFDVEQEKLKRMRLPEALAEVCPLLLNVKEQEGLLSVKHCTLSGGVMGALTNCDIWVKKEYNVGSSWCKVVSFEVEAGLGSIICLRENGKVLASSKEGELVSFDPNTRQTKGLHIRGYGRCSVLFHCAYTESLALLGKDRGVVSYEEDKNQRFVANRGHLLKEGETGSSHDDEPNEAVPFERKLAVHDMVKLLNQLQKFRGSSSNPFGAAEAH